MAWVSATQAQSVPTQLQGSADAARVRSGDSVLPKTEPVTLPEIKNNAYKTNGYKSSGNERAFTLNHVVIDGGTVFSSEALASFYVPFLNQPATTQTAYQIADAITAAYHARGYFLSVASVMDVSRSNNLFKIHITEGYVGDIQIEGDTDLRANSLISAYLEGITSQKPISSAALESFLLRLNDLPGHSFRAVLARADAGPEGAVKLVLIPLEKQSVGSLSMDNYGSRFLGPHEAVLSYSANLIPMGQTTITAIGSLPMDELRNVSLQQSITIAPSLTIGATASHTRARPGYTLKPFDIQSNSTSLAAYLHYQWIRQREENLALKLSLDGRHSTTDILNTPFMRDDVRALRTSVEYERADAWNGISSAKLSVSHGISGLGASNAGDANLSRAEAKPNFTKAEMAVSRSQRLSETWSAQASISGQVANGPLYSSEEFGYGGQDAGRAYDSSEITGDHGVSGSIEIRYSGLDEVYHTAIQPYAFYDAGMVWNDDRGQRAQESGSSAGAGVRFSHQDGFSGHAGIAVPLTRNASNPLYGARPDAPRAMVQLSQRF